MMVLLRRLRLYDHLTLGYLLLVVVFLAMSPHRPQAALQICLVHGAAMIAIIVASRFADRARFLQIVHDFYPLPLFTVLFSEFTDLAPVLLPYWLEPLLIEFDFWIFGATSHQWTAAHLSPAVFEFLAFAYWSYYLIIPGTILLASRKNYPHELIAATTQLCLTMYACYVLFILSPARGPHHALPANGASMIGGGFFTNLIRGIQKVGSVQGAAFPSSHVAVAWAMFFVLRRHSQELAWVAGFVITALTVSVVTVGYHFALDAMGGVVVAFGINGLLNQKKTTDGTSYSLSNGANHQGVRQITKPHQY